MKIKTIFFILTASLFFNCSNNTNSEEFINKTTGRYLFNSDETIEVYFTENVMYLKWRGGNAIKPLKVDDGIFFVKEMNEKIQFLTDPNNRTDFMVLVPKETTDSITYNYRKLDKGEKVAREYIDENLFDKALEAYIQIKANDSLDGALNENEFNKLGYFYMNDKKYDKAKGVFKINIALHPQSSNVYDSYADVMKRSGDTVQAIEYYKKSLEIDSGNRGAKQFVKKHDKK